MPKQERSKGDECVYKCMAVIVPGIQSGWEAKFEECEGQWKVLGLQIDKSNCIWRIAGNS